MPTQAVGLSSSSRLPTCPDHIIITALSSNWWILTWLGRLPGLPLIGQHLRLHVPHGPGLPGLVLQGTVVMGVVGGAQSEAYPG